MSRDPDPGAAADRQTSSARARARAAFALRTLREYRGLTQKRLALLSGISKTTISDYERGQMAISSEKLVALLGGLGLSTRAWETTLRHVQWLDYLEERSQSPEQRPRDEDLDLYAEGIGRDLERAATDLLKLLGVRSREEPRG